jgi:hypothetical protein
MKLRFVTKKFEKRGNYVIMNSPAKEAASAPQKAAPKLKNKKSSKTTSDMNEMEKIATAEEVMAAMAPEVKVVKKDRGLIERTESSKIILTEDNRQVLND